MESKVALYESPHQCPFDYLNLYEDPVRNGTFIVESKLKTKKNKELDHIYDTLDSYKDDWNQIRQVFPNIEQCGDPYQKYLSGLKQFYDNQKYLPSTPTTTTPIYTTESFDGTTKIDLPSIYTNNNINIRQLTRSVNDSSQVNTDRYMLPNSPNTNGNEQIDTSVKPAVIHIPITYNDHTIQKLKNQMVDNDFEVQRTYQKQILQMSDEIEQLRRQIEVLRQQVIQEKAHFEDLDQSTEDKHQQIMNANRLNVELLNKIEELKKKNDDIENLYLKTDSQRNTLELRLKQVRSDLENDIKQQGYTYLPPTNWTMNQWRPPICLPETQQMAQPTQEGSSQYLKVFNEGKVPPLPPTVSNIPQNPDPIDYVNLIK
jgi:hypothetical protein